MDLVFAPSQIETWPIDRLRPYVRNAKIHGTDQVAKIAASMVRIPEHPPTHSDNMRPLVPGYPPTCDALP